MRYVIFLLAIATSCVASAQRSQSTSGPNSPIINQGSHGTVVHNTYQELTESEMQSRLRRSSEKSLNEVSRRIEKGEIEAAQDQLDQYLSRRSPQDTGTALALYTKAQLYAASEDVGKAAQVMSGVVNIEPKNCYYKAAYGTLLMYLHRVQDTQALLDEEQSRGRDSCLLKASAGERSMLLLMKVWLSAEQRDQESALSSMETAHRTLLEITVAQSPQELVQPSCLFSQIASAYWVNTQEERWPKSQEACERVLLSAKPGQKSSAIELMTAFYSDLSDRETLKVGSQIDAAYKSFDGVPFPLSDQVRRRALFGAFKSDYGMKLLHSDNQAERAAQAYAQAFYTFEPLLDSGRPFVIQNFALLVIRIFHLEEITAVAVFPDTDTVVRAAMVKAGRAKLLSNGRSTCEALGWLASAANRVQYYVAANTLSAKAEQCREVVTPSRSFSGMMQAYRERDSDFVSRDLNLLSDRIEARSRLFGFPEVKDIEAKQSMDLWIRGRLRLKGQSTSDVAGPDAIQDFLQAAELGSKHLESSSARIAVTGSLPYLELDERTRDWALRLLGASKETEEALPPFLRCISQFFGLTAGDAVAAFSIRNKDDQLLGVAVEHQITFSSGGNRCKNLPADRDLGAGVHAEEVDRLISDVLVLNAVLAARGEARGPATKN